MDELQISGKRYISSRRAAREHGYTSDYVGQLIRGGKVKGQKVGRAWYVDEESFNVYLGAEGEGAAPLVTAEAQPVEIVATPEPEPAPTEFPAVEDSAPELVETPVVATVPEPVENTEKLEAPTATAPVQSAAPPVEVPRRVPLHVSKKEEPATPAQEPAPTGLRYVAEDEPALPIISRMPRAHELAPVSVSDVRLPAVAQPRRLSMVPLVALGVLVLLVSVALSSTTTLRLSIERGSAAAAWYSLEF